MASTIIAGNTTNSGTAISSDNTGALEIKTGSGAGTTALTIDASQNVTAANNLNATGFSSVSTFGFKNRIINGAMVIDQRNAGASVSVNVGSQVYTVDRWFAQATASSGVFTVQRSTTAPSGFINSLVATVSTTDSSLAATDLYLLSQFIEGFNVADLGWGTASAATVTLSFWVRSSVTGTYGGSLVNSAVTRSYPFTYTISAANTFEYKTITIPGDTSGTWLTDNGVGIRVYFGLGMGSTYSGTANAWASAFYISATGATNLMATSGATLYITGVQLEKGSTATSFDFRDYGRELMLCQRYAQWVSFNLAFSAASAGTFLSITVPYKVDMRATPAFASLTADPNATQFAVNNSTNAFNATYSGISAGMAALTATAAGSCGVYGYRSLATAEL